MIKFSSKSKMHKLHICSDDFVLDFHSFVTIY